MDRSGIVDAQRAVIAVLIMASVFAGQTLAKEKATKKREIEASAMIKAFKRNQPKQQSPIASKKQASPKKRSSGKQTDVFAKKAQEDSEATPPFLDEFFDEADYYDLSEECCDCGEFCCDDTCCGGSCFPAGRARIYAGFEATFLQPRYEKNIAFSTQQSDSGNTFESYTDTEFDYDLELAPRVWFGADRCDGLGWRVSWWEFDHAPADETTSPPANGFGEVRNPPFGQTDFGDVDISSTVPSDVYSAASNLEAYTIDLEAMKRTGFCSWDLAIGGGLRYASVEQSYEAELRNGTNTLLGQIDYEQSIEGIGPTVSLSAARSLSGSLGFFCNARGSILFGDGESLLTAGEDLDQTVPLNTTIVTSRDDLLSIGELQVGLRWQSCNARLFRPFLSVAMEGQLWNGAGTATSEEGTLGFFGFSSGFGLDW